MLVALVLEAPVSTVATSTSAPSINIVHKILNLKEFTLFCREFENVVNRAFFVFGANFFLGGGELGGANCYAFCDYVHTCKKRGIRGIYPRQFFGFMDYRLRTRV